MLKQKEKRSKGVVFKRLLATLLTTAFVFVLVNGGIFAGICPTNFHTECLRGAPSIVEKTVYVQIENDAGVIRSGSGVIIDGNRVLTADHVIEIGGTITVYDSDGNIYFVKDVFRKEEFDLAILTFDQKIDSPAVKISKIFPKIGEDVYVCGSPNGNLYFNTLTKGIISGLNRSWQKIPFANFYQTDAFVTHGTSGGPWVNMNGELISITSWGNGWSGNFSFGVSLPLINRTIEAHNEYLRNNSRN